MNTSGWRVIFVGNLVTIPVKFRLSLKEIKQ